MVIKCRINNKKLLFIPPLFFKIKNIILKKHYNKLIILTIFKINSFDSIFKTMNSLLGNIL